LGCRDVLRKFTVILGISFAGFFAEPAKAIDGNDLIKLCGYGEIPNSCFYYFIGVFEAMVVSETNFGARPPYCMPDAVTAGQAADVVAQYVRQNPQNRHLGAITLTAEAWSQAWPCN